MHSISNVSLASEEAEDWASLVSAAVGRISLALPLPLSRLRGWKAGAGEDEDEDEMSEREGLRVGTRTAMGAFGIMTAGGAGCCCCELGSDPLSSPLRI